MKVPMSIPSMHTSHTLIRLGPFDGTLLSPSVTQLMEGCQDYGKSSYDVAAGECAFSNEILSKFEERKRSAEKEERLGSACRILAFRKS